MLHSFYLGLFHLHLHKDNILCLKKKKDFWLRMYKFYMCFFHRSEAQRPNPSGYSLLVFGQ